MRNSLSRPRTRSYWLLAIFAMVALVAAACGGDDDDDTSNGDSDNGGDTPAEPANGDGGNGGSGNGMGMSYDGLSGNVDVDGSSTVFPISVAMAEEFGIETGGDVRVNVGLSGTGGGFEKFCRGETHVSNASRPIVDDELEACAENGIEDVVGIQVAIDALSVVRNPENDWAQCLTSEEVVDIFSDDGPTNWSEVRDDYPDEPIVAFYPGADSGTFDYFVEVLEDVKGEDAVHITTGSSSEDDNVLVTGVQGDPNAIAYFGLAYFVEAQGVEPVSVDGGDGCVEPSIENALNGSYVPFSRPLFIYTREEFLANNPEVLGFIHYYMNAQLEDIVTEVGYAPMPEDLKQEQLDKIEPFVN
ncbi:MAG: PstS family phosphate ABC transporter substrate-binding protein [Dehalococcoidia bacterium]|nr:PstS family phosphate ABC transporter substrate-binding protein [Dehalococcoidia bacterium]